MRAFMQHLHVYNVFVHERVAHIPSMYYFKWDIRDLCALMSFVRVCNDDMCAVLRIRAVCIHDMMECIRMLHSCDACVHATYACL